MPGIFVNDGGETSSTIGKILGNIAETVGPQAAAQAALTAQQTQAADLTNEDAWNKIVSGSNLDIPGLTRSLQMNAPDPANPGAGGGVAGAVTNLAVPPGTRGPGGRLSTLPDESGYTPEQKYLLNEAINGRLGADALSKNVDTFQTPLVGAGGTAGAIRTRATTPMSPGQVINTTGQPGSPTIGGGSSYVHAGDEAAGGADYKLAMDDLESGGNAKANLGKIDPIIELFKSAVAPGVAGLPQKIQGDALHKIVVALGGDPNKYIDSAAAKTLLKQNLLSFVGGLKDNAGNPLPRGAIDLIVQQIPDPEADLNGFLASMGWVKAHLQAQAANADAAQNYINTRTSDPNAGPAFHTARGVNAAAEADAYHRSGLKGPEEGGGAGGAGGGGGGEIYVFPDEASMDAAGLPVGTRVRVGGKLGTVRAR